MGWAQLSSSQSDGRRVFITLGHAESQRPRYGLHIVLFLLTVLTTLFAGAESQISFVTQQSGPLNPFDVTVKLLQHPSYLIYGLPFSFTLLGILFSHEMGHYIACRYYGINATLPFFIPMPFGPVGTFGAFIRIKSPITRKKALFDIGIAGPIAGFVMTVPALIIGVYAARAIDLSPLYGKGYEIYYYGEPLLYRAVAFLFQRGVEGELMLHPIGFAAWFGLLATAINLLPMGQLDGGHILYAVTGRHFRVLSRVFWILTLAGGVLSIGWIIWALLIRFVVGLDHPPTYDEDEPIGTARMVLFCVAIAIFILCFMPVPIWRETLG
ncbi:MAG: site-2 protease family protein [Acidobacteria bacterium]|nr:site-2 protease family protein [Acidobacteriota bacterium]